jgi:hypothetical protein
MNIAYKYEDESDQNDFFEVYLYISIGNFELKINFGELFVDLDFLTIEDVDYQILMGGTENSLSKYSMYVFGENMNISLDENFNSTVVIPKKVFRDTVVKMLDSYYKMKDLESEELSTLNLPIPK